MAPSRKLKQIVLHKNDTNPKYIIGQSSFYFLVIAVVEIFNRRNVQFLVGLINYNFIYLPFPFNWSIAIFMFKLKSLSIMYLLDLDLDDEVDLCFL